MVYVSPLKKTVSCLRASQLTPRHLQVEEAYTQEAVLASDREQSLRERLEQLQNRSASVKEASEQSKQQVESLQEQLRSMTSQRDQAVQQFQVNFVFPATNDENVHKRLLRNNFDCVVDFLWAVFCLVSTP